MRTTGLLYRSFASLVLFSTLGATLPAQAQQAVEDGVKVKKMSPLRNMVPEAELEQAANQQYTSLKQQAQQKNVLVSADHPQAQRLQAIAKRLIPQATRWNPRASDWQWEVSLIDSKEINAFCMPGGKIAFFSGLLDTLKLTDDEVAIVMGHEMAHALREHSRERVAKAGLTNAGAKVVGMGLSALFGIDPNLTDTATGIGANMLVLRYSRDDETESDVVGLDIAARAGFDPRAGVALWQKMAAVNQRAPLQWFSSHPSGANRIAEMKKHLPSVMPLYAKSVGKPVKALPPYQTNVKGIAPVS